MMKKIPWHSLPIPYYDITLGWNICMFTLEEGAREQLYKKK